MNNKCILFLLILAGCESIKVEIMEQVSMTGLERPGMILIEKHPNYCTALLSLGIKNSGGYKVAGLRYESKSLFVQSDKPMDMAVMMMRVAFMGKASANVSSMVTPLIFNDDLTGTVE